MGSGEVRSLSPVNKRNGARGGPNPKRAHPIGSFGAEFWKPPLSHSAHNDAAMRRHGRGSSRQLHRLRRFGVSRRTAGFSDKS